MTSSALVVRGARTHNLKNVDCEIPHGRLTVVTGVSGAGKSSLVFDTVYAEAQRRFVESMSTYVRQFLEQMERPDVESIDGVLPAVALEARNSVKNARATVGTLTEVHDVLRLFFTYTGIVSCPNGHGPVRGFGPQELADRLIELNTGKGSPGEAVVLVSPLARPKRLANEKLRELVRQGYFRRVDAEGEIERLTPSARWTTKEDPLLLALGRFKPSLDKRARLVEAIEEGYMLSAGRLRILRADGSWIHAGRALTCEECGASMERPTPPLFSFNSPLGACPECQGFGRVLGIDPQRVIPDPSKTLGERPIAPWNSPAYKKHYPRLLSACRLAGIPLDVPLTELGQEALEFLWSGEGAFTNLDRFFARLERKNYRMHVRVLLARYRAYEECPSCDGRRLRPESLAVEVGGKNLAELSAYSIEGLLAWLEAHLESEGGLPGEKARSHIVELLRLRLETLARVGLGYLTLDRQGRTLSGGESQRIQLASALGNGLTGTLYVLDEPTIGLHPQDSDRLLSLLRDLAARGNTVLVVEHDRTLIEGADHVIDIGPGAGEWGGELLAEGPLAAILKSKTPTAEQLSRKPPKRSRAEMRRAAAALEALAKLRVEGARENNLRGFDLEMPLGCLVAVTGVSGSGKSTLVENVIHGTWQRARGVVDVEPGDCDALEGFDDLADVVLVDQRPLGRSSRSNPVTYIKAWDHIRKIFAATPGAQARGITPGHFSFNVDKGRCPECKGTGTTEIDMQFMAAVSVVCETCDGRRFKPDVLSATWDGYSIDRVLELTVEEACERFSAYRALVKKLGRLQQVGLGYLRLGQSTATLSGGEAQRLKLATFLDERKKPKGGKADQRLFLFDEPTTGLHLADIELLHQTLCKLVEAGHGVVVVEHSTDLIAQADWFVDLGPGGGIHGGQLLYSGPPEAFLDHIESPTAEILRRHLGWKRPVKKRSAKKAS